MSGFDIGPVTGLWRYPASSLAGEALDEILVEAEGVAGDRMFGLVDVATGEIARPDGNPKWHPVPRIRTRLIAGSRLEIATPESGWLPAPGPEADRAVTLFLGFDAAVRPLASEAAPAGYSGALTQARYWKSPVHLLTTASLARLRKLHPTGVPDARRFRPNILVAMPEIDGSFPETEWIGGRLAIGEIELTVAEPCRRCGFTILAQDRFDHDPEILRTLVRHNNHNIGVYCDVDTPGRVIRGDVVRFL